MQGRDAIHSNAHKLFCVLAAICHSTTFRHKVCSDGGGGGDAGVGAGEHCAVCRIYRHNSHV